MLDGEEPPDSESLIWYESSILPDYYKPYFKSKRVAFASNASEHANHWQLYTAIDKAWFRGLEDCQVGGGPERCLPLMLYMTSHAKMRIGLELGFSGCMGEARSILRDCIEFAAHAHRLHIRPDLQIIWPHKEEQPKAWDEEFWLNKPTKLFEGLQELYSSWKSYSDLGSHANLQAICRSVAFARTDKTFSMTVRYHGGETGTPYKAGLLELLSTCSHIERLFYDDFSDRLRLDVELTQMRFTTAMIRSRLVESMRTEITKEQDAKS